MIKSMTGFGTATRNSGKATITAEVKSLNSKFMDLSLRLPRGFNEKESEVRNLLSDKLERGKVSVSLDYQTTGSVEIRQQYNEELFLAYYAQLKKLADRAMTSYDRIFELALNSPDVIQNSGRNELEPAVWEDSLAVLQEAIQRCDEFRVLEGRGLEEKLRQYIAVISEGLQGVEELDPKRIERVRSKIKGRVTAFFGEEGFDQNRLEQEIIFYIEKLDIHEERVRLRAHLEHYVDTLSAANSNGKKLGFIAQEIGREINTIGSKANDADIQKHVVSMKEELEKIKEQLNNIL